MPSRIFQVETAFKELGVSEDKINTSIENLKYWLLHPDFENYHEQIDYLIETGKYEELLDCFFQVIPFGTGGRRGRVGIGPNRINPWTIAASAQGHSQYLIKKYGEDAKKRGIVVAYDVRQYMRTDIYNKDIHNPIWGINSKELAEIASSVYVKNGIKVHFFHEITPTPQLSFTIRELNAIAGINISASHNPPDYNGKKVYDETGGQLIPHFDQELADEVNNNVNIYDVEWGIFQQHVEKKEIKIIESRIEDRFIETICKISRTNYRNSRILYSPLHGTGKVTIFKAMKRLGFDIHIEPESSIPSGEFETVPNQIPNPELEIVYERLKLYADEISADLIITSDPDADRMGMCVKLKDGEWNFLDGNQTATLLGYYLLRNERQKNRMDFDKKPIVLTSLPVTTLVEKIGNKFGADVRNQFLPGFKYFGNELNLLEKSNQIENFLVAMEDTFGHLTGNYARDKDGATASIILSEFQGELLLEGKTLIDALNEIYTEFGYYKNITKSIEFEHAYQLTDIDNMMDNMREKKEKNFQSLNLKDFKDYWEGSPIISNTDKSSRNLLAFNFNLNNYDNCRIIVRPSGTEPKLKVYLELVKKVGSSELENIEKEVDEKGNEIMKDIIDELSLINK